MGKTLVDALSMVPKMEWESAIEVSTWARRFGLKLNSIRTQGDTARLLWAMSGDVVGRQYDVC